MTDGQWCLWLIAFVGGYGLCRLIHLRESPPKAFQCKECRGSGIDPKSRWFLHCVDCENGRETILDGNRSP